MKILELSRNFLTEKKSKNQNYLHILDRTVLSIITQCIEFLKNHFLFIIELHEKV